MTRTPFNDVNKNFSYLSHLVARKEIYSRFLASNELEYDYIANNNDNYSKILDRKMSIDAIIKENFRNDQINLTVQERFRERKYKRYNDITLTLWSEKSNKKSELFKIKSQIFVYGITDGKITGKGKKRKIEKEPTTFLKAAVIDVTKLISGLIHNNIEGQVGYTNRSNQRFIAFDFADLYSINSVLWQQW